MFEVSLLHSKTLITVYVQAIRSKLSHKSSLCLVCALLFYMWRLSVLPEKNPEEDHPWEELGDPHFDQGWRERERGVIKFWLLLLPTSFLQGHILNCPVTEVTHSLTLKKDTFFQRCKDKRERQGD